MNDAELFIETVEDLRRRSGLGATEYDMIQASGLMRRLLLDQHSLAHSARRAAKKRGLRLAHPEFTWIKTYGFREGRWIANLQIDPVIFAAIQKGKKPATTSAAEFLKHSVMRSGPEDLSTSVKQVIKFFANKRGGVHHDVKFDGKSDDTPEELKSLSPTHEAALTVAVAAIARIVVRALEPMQVSLYAEKNGWLPNDERPPTRRG